MEKSTAIDAPIDRRADDSPKTRECLRCKTPFESQWSGERICTRCKSSNAWRSGTPFTSHSSGGRR